jgi:4-aminobutyrate aminotransferase-like enzyme
MRLWQTNALQEIILVRGQGCTVWDQAGQPYLDLLSGTWCNVLGYGHPRWVKAIQRQVSELAHVGAPFPTGEVGEALSKLGEILPSALNRAVFLNTGSEAVELALKMARAATGATGVAVIEKGYYGATTYALALSEAGRAAPYLPRLGDVHRLPAPTCRRCPAGCSWPCGDFACLDALRALADEGEGCIAAVLYEPVMAVGGMIVPPPGYGALLRDLATRCGALLIAEEVTTGVGRTGRWFGFEHDGIVPDIVVIGKAIGAGLPVSAVVTTQKVEARCQGVLRHVQSPTATFRLFPPYIISIREIDRFLAAFEDALSPK